MTVRRMILRKFAMRGSKNDERMTVLHLPENGGLSNARNAGFPHVRGEYVFFMDSDDVIDANLLEQVKASLEVNRADVVVFRTFRAVL